MLPKEQAIKKRICAFCESKIDLLSRLDQETYMRTGLCPPCNLANIRGDLKTLRNPSQMPLPFIGKVPRVITLGPLPMTQLILYKPGLLSDVIIKCQNKGTLGVYHLICPSMEASKEISMYLAGKKNV